MIRGCQSPLDTEEGGQRLVQVVVELFAIIRKDNMGETHTHEQLSGWEQWLISKTGCYKRMKLALCIYLEQDS